MGKVINWELCRKFKFDHTKKWSMNNSESVLENEAHKLFWDFEIQTEHLMSTRWSDSQQNKRTCRILDFAVSADHTVKLKEGKNEG